MPSFSKNKERNHLAQVIPKLNSWWGEKFVRVPASGALRWKDNEHWTYADIVPPPSFPFVIECKFHVEVDLDEVLRKGIRDGRITWFWFWQTIRDSLRATEELKQTIYPLLVYRANRQPDHLVLQTDLFTRIPEEKRTFPYLLVNIPQCSPFAVCLLDSFLQAVPRQDFEKLILRRNATHDGTLNGSASEPSG